MVSNVVVRNLSEDVAGALKESAALHDRTLEAECRHAIRAWVEPMMWRQDRTLRRQEVSQRLTEALHQANGPRSLRKLRPSQLALAIGEDRAETLERWFTGEEEPSFQQLRSLAEQLGVSEDWLLHGDGAPYPASWARIPGEAEAGVKWLLEPDPVYGCPVAIRFVRSASKEGRLAVVREFPGDRARVHSTDYHVSDVIGAGGEGDLVALSTVWHLLYQCLGKPGFGVLVTSHVAAPKAYATLMEGAVNPICVLKEMAISLWWHDFWDRKQIPKGEDLGHWPGWSKIALRISAIVRDDPRLNEEYGMIERGRHPLLSG